MEGGANLAKYNREDFILLKAIGSFYPATPVLRVILPNAAFGANLDSQHFSLVTYFPIKTSAGIPNP